ncbi:MULTISPECIES: superinfection immunity protein [Alteromonadaceae]|uniref:superinfection immunity protein n=1 Tax=Alteromonadaceae TaxID=72275 RepID=UPI001C0A63E5|nr:MULTISPECIES: superinfection immunity protein [Aliiglaciecola]MBU2879163.1 superinfection immunity protein [Aliiglaciecola lipolytica]MDO6713399.1 superinfection immunity protein [Aliiglaciecola sp. 2_MG-2023]MDO6754541.1 superinfection immunity protein [Aliiglaciecola sp. 1_MG-2023]
MEYIDNILASDNYVFMGLILIGVFILWFLPAMLALAFNRKHFKYILLACIPAGFSVIAWGGVMVWATTGKVFGKYANKVNAEN